jgi:hypothetical protein
MEKSLTGQLMLVPVDDHGHEDSRGGPNSHFVMRGRRWDHLHDPQLISQSDARTDCAACLPATVPQTRPSQKKEPKSLAEGAVGNIFSSKIRGKLPASSIRRVTKVQGSAWPMPYLLAHGIMTI